MTDILQIKDLKTSFQTKSGKIYAADGVSLDIPRGKISALVGESGSGKSVTALSILRLIQEPGKIESVEILLHDGETTQDILRLDERRLRAVRGNSIAMIFQEPMTSLNPVYTVGNQIMEVITLHQGLSRKLAKEKTIEMLETVGIPHPQDRVNNYPHEMSGGMRQRVMIAMALSCTPRLLIADEPTTALDVTIQAQILELISNLVKGSEMSVLLITHDLGLVAAYAAKVNVMYAGQIVEESDTVSLFKSPKHPYTKGLLASLPTLRTRQERRLHAIPGMVPELAHLPHGCRFQERCEKVTPDCRARGIDLFVHGERKYRCVHPY